MANLRAGLALLAGLSLIPVTAAVAQQQSQSSSQQKDKDKEKPKPKAKKVWSEDDVKELRGPGDQVEEKKDETKAAGKEAADAKGEKPGEGAANADPNAPKTIEEVDKLMEIRFQEIKEQQQIVADLLRQLYDSSSTQTREELDAKIAHTRETLREVQLEHAKLNELREEMVAKKKAAEEGKPAEEAKPPVKPPVR